MGTATIPARAREDEACGRQLAPHGGRRAGAREERARPAAAENGSGFGEPVADWLSGHVPQGAGANATAESGLGIRRGEGGKAAGTAARPTGNAPRTRAEGSGGPSPGYCGTASRASAEAEGAAAAQEPEARTETAEGGEAAA